MSVCCPAPQIDEIANALKAGLKKNASGVSVTVVNGQGSQTKAMSDVQSFVAQGYQGIWTTLISGQGYDNLTKTAASKKIAWLNFSGSAVTGATINIVAPNYQLGFSIGESAAAWMTAHNLSGAEVGALMDTGPANADRTKGFVDGVRSKLPSVTVFTVGQQKLTSVGAAADGANLLQAHPRIKVLYGWFADDATGLVQAAKEAGNADPNKFLVADFEGNQPIFDLIGSHSLLQLASSLGYPFAAIAGEALLEQAMEGKSIPPTAVNRWTIVTPTNVATIKKQESNPLDYPDRIKSIFAFSDQPITFGQLPTMKVTPVEVTP